MSKKRPQGAQPESLCLRGYKTKPFIDLLYH